VPNKAIASLIYEFDRSLKQIIEVIKKELSQENQKLIFEYDKWQDNQ
jgi:hypothetical protein